MESPRDSARCDTSLGLEKEPRATIRYALEAPVTFTWTDDHGNLRENQGCTRDISTRGVYVIASGCPPRGTAVDMNIYLPALTDESRALRMEMAGRVQRVDAIAPGNPGNGFSVCNERVTLLCVS